jgi:hypothetical protein
MSDNSNYISKLVYAILTKNAEARDDMMLVVKSIHDFEMSLLSIEKSDYYDSIFNHRLSSIKTIDRLWRKAQEENISLRGKSWLLRQVQSGQISMKMVQSQFQLSLFEDFENLDNDAPKSDNTETKI